MFLGLGGGDSWGRLQMIYFRAVTKPLWDCFVERSLRFPLSGFRSDIFLGSRLETECVGAFGSGV